MLNLFLKDNLIPIEDQPFEIVERKGLGHPDTLADGIAESISIEYTDYCLNKFKAVLHHNVDKIAVIGGLGEFDFGYAKMKKPIKIILNGRMSESFGKTTIDIKEIQVSATKKYIRKVLPFLDIQKWVNILSFVSASSRNPVWFHPRTIDDLPELKSPYANDTATIVSFWPLSCTEKIVLECEKLFYNADLTPKFNFMGQDIKIMAIRQYKNLNLIMCIPFFAAKIHSAKEYEEKLKNLHKKLLNHLNNKFSNFKINLYLNTEDQRVKNKTTAKGYYFVISGSALDYGEEGVAGRGNRSYGFISSVRPYSIESVCGKNPVYHVGKVYTYIADMLSKRIAIELDCEVNVIITTRNGDPLYNPHSLIVNISKKGEKTKIQQIITEELERRDWTEKIIKYKTFLPINNLQYE